MANRKQPIDFQQITEGDKLEFLFDRLQDKLGWDDPWDRDAFCAHLNEEVSNIPPQAMALLWGFAQVHDKKCKESFENYSKADDLERRIYEVAQNLAARSRELADRLVADRFKAWADTGYKELTEAIADRTKRRKQDASEQDSYWKDFGLSYEEALRLSELGGE